MKKLILLILTLLYFFQINAQYHSFIDENKIWVESYKQIDRDNAEQFLPNEWAWIIYPKGDTIVDSLNYKKFYKQQYYFGTQINQKEFIQSKLSLLMVINILKSF